MDKRAAPATDPYSYHPADIEEPPATLAGILRRIGPGMLVTASIVGTGELIAVVMTACVLVQAGVIRA